MNVTIYNLHISTLFCFHAMYVQDDGMIMTTAPYGAVHFFINCLSDHYKNDAIDLSGGSHS